MTSKRGFVGEFYRPRKVDNSFLGRASAYRHCPLWSSLSLRLWFTRFSHSVRLFPTEHRAKSFPSLFRSGFRSALCLRACLAQIADDYAHTRTVPAAPDPPDHGRLRAAVAKRNGHSRPATNSSPRHPTSPPPPS